MVISLSCQSVHKPTRRVECGRACDSDECARDAALKTTTRRNSQTRRQVSEDLLTEGGGGFNPREKPHELTGALAPERALRLWIEEEIILPEACTPNPPFMAASASAVSVPAGLRPRQQRSHRGRPEGKPQ